MRVVLDPNVIVSALLSRSGSPAQILRAWRAGEFELVTSAALLDELERVLAYPKLRKRITAEDAAAVLRMLRAGSLDAPDTAPAGLRSADPDDDHLLGLAQSTRAALVSGDRHLLDLRTRLPIFDPAGFLAFLADPTP